MENLDELKMKALEEGERLRRIVNKTHGKQARQIITYFMRTLNFEQRRKNIDGFMSCVITLYANHQQDTPAIVTKYMSDKEAFQTLATAYKLGLMSDLK